jgi:hypothetical protein
MSQVALWWGEVQTRRPILQSNWQFRLWFQGCSKSEDQRRNLNGIKLYTFTNRLTTVGHTNCVCDDSRTYQPFRPLRIAIKGLDYFYLSTIIGIR